MQNKCDRAPAKLLGQLLVILQLEGGQPITQLQIPFYTSSLTQLVNVNLSSPLQLVNGNLLVTLHVAGIAVFCAKNVPLQ